MASYQSVGDGQPEKPQVAGEKSPTIGEVVLGQDGDLTRKIVMSSSFRDKELSKWERIIADSSNRAPPSIVPCIKASAPCCSWTVLVFEACVPCYIRVIKAGISFLAKLPQEELGILAGIVLCFFGGLYPLTLGAAEAWKQCGGTDIAECVKLLNEQFLQAVEASEKDDLVDDDHDGIADVEQLTGKELVARKSRILLTATDPSVLDKGFKGLYTGFVAVVGVLKLRFAKTIALGSAIGDFLVTCGTIPCTQVLSHVMEPDLHKWIPNIITYTAKVIAILVAYQLQKAISAFYSAIRGGLLVTRNFMRILIRKQVPIFKDLDPDDTYLDELAGWALAVLGFYVQLKSGFTAPWIVQILLWPLGLMEGTLLWATTRPSSESFGP